MYRSVTRTVAAAPPISDRISVERTPNCASSTPVKRVPCELDSADVSGTTGSDAPNAPMRPGAVIVMRPAALIAPAGPEIFSILFVGDIVVRIVSNDRTVALSMIAVACTARRRGVNAGGAGTRLSTLTVIEFVDVLVTKMSACPDPNGSATSGIAHALVPTGEFRFESTSGHDACVALSAMTAVAPTLPPLWFVTRMLRAPLGAISGSSMLRNAFTV